MLIYAHIHQIVDAIVYLSTRMGLQVELELHTGHVQSADLLRVSAVYTAKQQVSAEHSFKVAVLTQPVPPRQQADHRFDIADIERCFDQHVDEDVVVFPAIRFLADRLLHERQPI